MNDGEVVPSHSEIPLGGAEDVSSIPVQARRCQPQSARRVQQIDPDTGNVLRVFGSAEHAARALGGKNASNIRNAILRDGTSYGYRWRYLSGNGAAPARMPDSSRPVEQIDPDTGRNIRTFPGVCRAARAFGLSSGSDLYRAAHTGSICCGFLWRYADCRGYPVERLDPDTGALDAVFLSVVTAGGPDPGPVCRALVDGGVAGGYRWRMLDEPAIERARGSDPLSGAYCEVGGVFKIIDRNGIVYGYDAHADPPERSFTSVTKGEGHELSPKLVDALTLWVETGDTGLLCHFLR